MTLTLRLVLALAAALWIAGCGGSDEGSETHDDHDHPHGEHNGDDHAPGGGENDSHDHGDSGEHGGHHGPTVALASFAIGDMNVTASQAGGPVTAGQESVLFVTLPESIAAQATVRAWIGTDDRTLSGGVASGHYSANAGHHDIHVMAPAPLPADAMWWVEVEKADGTKLVGSTAAHLE